MRIRTVIFSLTFLSFFFLIIPTNISADNDRNKNRPTGSNPEVIIPAQQISEICIFKRVGTPKEADYKVNPGWINHRNNCILL